MDEVVMNIHTEKWQSWNIVSLEGKFGINFVGEIRKALESLSDGISPKIALDLSLANHLDSTGLTLIMNFQSRLKKKNGSMVLFGVNEDNMEIIKTIGFDSIVPIYRTRPDFERSVEDKQI
jgi:anti-anti-sigma factor